jgi:hypothetical protein
MASWTSVVAMSGFDYNGHQLSLIAVPRMPHRNFTCFWSTGTGWGTFSYKPAGSSRSQFTLRVLAGALPCRSFEITGVGSSASARRNGKATACKTEQREGRTIFHLDEAITLAKDDELLLESEA